MNIRIERVKKSTPFLKLGLSSDVTITSGSDTTISWDYVVESKDDAESFWSVGTPQRIYPSQGVYVCELNVTFSVNNQSQRMLGIRKNAESYYQVQQIVVGASANDIVSAGRAILIDSATDYITAVVRQESGSSGDVTTDTYFCVTKVI